MVPEFLRGLLTPFRLPQTAIERLAQRRRDVKARQEPLRERSSFYLLNQSRTLPQTNFPFHL
jgi:hypothetical protein